MNFEEEENGMKLLKFVASFNKITEFKIVNSFSLIGQQKEDSDEN
jgi:hypothetical protein